MLFECGWPGAKAGVVLACALGATVTLNGCDDLLDVENPGVIDERDVTDPFFISQMMTAVVNEFQTEQSFLAYAGAKLTDEALNGHNFVQWRDIDLRIVEDDNGQVLEVYESAQAARAVADDMIERLGEVLESPGNSIELATALAYAGYAYTRLGEYFCYAPIETEGPAVRSDVILVEAVRRFDDAIAMAEGLSGNEARRIQDIALVGAARASLQRGQMDDAMDYASQVPEGFIAYVRHVGSPTNQQNYFWSPTRGTNRTIGVGPSFLDLNDRRVRHTADWVRGHNQQTRLYVPMQSPAFADWDPDIPADVSDDDLADLLGVEQDTDMVLASHLEARYILAEAGAMGDAELRAFIDERRAVGGQEPFAGDDLRAELRDQRRRDFFLSGHRLGDLRRYLELYGFDQFPTGTHPNNAEWSWGQYGAATCFIPHRNEGISNPNYQPLE